MSSIELHQYYIIIINLSNWINNQVNAELNLLTRWRRNLLIIMTSKYPYLCKAQKL